MTVGDVARFFVVEGYLWDWLTAGACIAVNLVIPGEVVKPLKRYYEATDSTLAYPYHESTVPSLALYLLVFVLPAVVFAVIALIKRSAGFVDCSRSSPPQTTGFKRWVNLVGCLRPSWLTVLKLNDPSEADEARLSYPSGHSAYMFFSMTVVSLYLVGKLELLHRPSQLLFLKAVLVVAPLALATFVAVSRIADYKHNPADVNAGCYIGMACGAFAYFLNYPSLFDPTSGLPKRRGAAAERAAAAHRAAAAATAANQLGMDKAVDEELQAIYSPAPNGIGARARRGG
ncbi:hypothetical protein GPECTOR_53g163 [Gonium pectorale]|uniref:Phosphatidic acid phosphatase type 2/haloperoxidase domain-containing protein n=1 Tax=Gonium pectorale TaxID=33097 RepID=A0A150G6W1_GONPE|nr:hypothetical protein GPECTOR_53g163 [Gonium pectorale]|eukprot:KXZ45577.1 hypothetical protein GPECTOR_53g163 [Gonium pectorale]